MLSKIVNKWMALEPGEQLMYWVLTMCVLLAGGMAAFFVLADLGAFTSMSIGLVALLGGAVGGFLSLFMFVVLFFSVCYPLLRKDPPAKPKAKKAKPKAKVVPESIV